jgi:hypothetical protein
VLKLAHDAGGDVHTGGLRDGIGVYPERRASAARKHAQRMSMARAIIGLGVGAAAVFGLLRARSLGLNLSRLLARGLQ